MIQLEKLELEKFDVGPLSQLLQITIRRATNSFLHLPPRLDMLILTFH